MGRCRRTEDEDEGEERPSTSRRRNPCKKAVDQFFQIIHRRIIQDQKLGLPSKFVRKFGNHLSDVATLKVPNDQLWKVELKKSDRNIWFDNGWQEFVGYHSIHAGHFLVFKYIGNSCFNVLIFDISGTEIQYPCDAHNVEDLNSGGECSMHHENKETEVNDDDDSVVFLDISPDDHETCTNHEESIQLHVEKIYWGSMKTSIRKNVQKSIEASQDFKSKYPFYMLVMYSTYMHRDLATVGLRFAKRYLPGKKGSLLLTVSGERTWNVNYTSSTNTSMTTGWNNFVTENELEVGDVCVFELINRNDILLKVTIFRNGKIHYKSKVHNDEDPAQARECPMAKNEEIEDEHETCRNRDESVQIHRAKILSTFKSKNPVEAARTFKSNNPFYMLVMSPSFICRNNVTVKASFSTKYLPDKILGSLTLMVSDGRTWHVNYSSKRNNTNTVLTKGWIDFVRENRLKKGDVCVFELINRDDLVLKVSIFRVGKKRARRIADNVEDPNYGRQCPVPEKQEISEDDSVVFLDASHNGHESVGIRPLKRRSCRTSTSSNPSKKRKEQRESEAPREHKEQKAIHAAKAFKSNNPFFFRVMCSSYLHHRFTLVTRDFAKRYISENKIGTLILTVPDGRTWPVKYKSTRKNNHTTLNSGWSTFVKNNGLEEGNVCVFELIDRKKLLLKVFIFRNAKIRHGSKFKNVQGPSDARKCSIPKEKEIKLKTPDGLEPSIKQDESGGMLTTKWWESNTYWCEWQNLAC